MAISWISGGLRFDAALLWITGLGFVHSVAIWSRWNAYKDTLGDTALMLPMGAAFGTLLAIFVAGEFARYAEKPVLIGGFALMLVAMFLLARERDAERKGRVRWGRKVAIAVILLGVTVVGIKVAALGFHVSMLGLEMERSRMAFGQFIPYFSAGYLLFAFLVAAKTLISQGGLHGFLPAKGAWTGVVMTAFAVSAAVYVFTAFAMFYAFGQGALVVLTEGARTLPSTVISVVLGKIQYREWGVLTRPRMAAFAAGSVGILLLVVGR
ncbi:MAG: hypothetical protein HYV77_00310 [Candidatus Wildermuthbacteria bacterium]|nr:hypothetical protein [Candidatus Wildermuthbacteria bacterium]